MSVNDLANLMAALILGLLVVIVAGVAILLLWANAEEKREQEARDVINDWRNKHGDY